MKLDWIRIERAAGVTQPFELTEFDSGFNVILGPNGSGKSVLCRVARELLWGDAEGRSTVASAQISTNTGAISIRRDAEKVEWISSEGKASRSRLPEAHLAGCFLLNATDLLSTGAQTDEQIAREIRKQMAGGFDLEAIRVQEFSVAPLHGRNAQRALEGAKKKLARVTEEFRRLAQHEDDLAELNREVLAAEMAAERVRVLQIVCELAKVRSEIATLELRLASLPPNLELLSGHELRHLDERESSLASRKAELSDLDTELARRRDELSTSASTIGTRAEEIAAWMDRARLLVQLERECLELAQSAAAADAALTESKAHLGADSVERGAMIPPASFLAELEEHLRLTTSNREALATTAGRLEAIPERIEASDAREIERGLSCLRKWCSTPDSVETKPRVRLLVTGGVGAFLLGLIVARSATEIGFGLFGAGLALCGWAISLTLTNRHAHASREAARAEFPSAELDEPSEWNLDCVQEQIQQLERELADALLESERCDERTYLEQRLAELELAEEHLEAARFALGERIGIADHSSALNLVELGQRFAAWRGASLRAAEADARADTAHEERRAQTAKLADWLAAREFSASDGTSALECLRELEKRVRSAEQAAEAIAQNEARRPRLEEAIESEALQIEHLYSNAKLPARNRVVLEQRVGMRADFLELKSELEAAQRSATRLFDSLPAGQPELELEAAEIELRSMEKDAAQIKELGAQRGKLEEKLRAAREGTGMSDALDEVARARDVLAEQHEEALDAHVGSSLLASIESEYRQSSSPDVLKRAIRLFGEFTQNRYELRLDQADGVDRFVAIDVASTRSLALSELSDGTRMQLLLAARFAFAIEIEEEPIPFFLDEALSMTDPDRFASIANVLFTLVAEGRQFVYLSSQPGDVKRFTSAAKRAGCDPPVVHQLAGARGRELAVADAAELSYELIPALPSIGSDTAEQYALRIGVPLPAPNSTARELNLFHLLRENIELFRTLKHAGCEAVGQWLQNVQQGAAQALCRDDAKLNWLSARCELAVVVFEVRGIGRGMPIGREQLLASGAVTANYLDDLTDLAGELFGDGREFLEVLASKSDERSRGFQTKKLERLTHWLEQNGFVDQREVLDLEAAHVLVQSALVSPIRDGALTLEEVVQLTNSLWAALESGAEKLRAKERQLASDDA